MKKKAIVFVLAALILCATPLFAIDGREVMERVHNVKKPSYTHSLAVMRLIDTDGSTQDRQIEEYSRDGDEQNVIIIFHSPAAVKNTRFLVVGDDQWIYLPSLRTTRRIASSEDSKSFMGSDASYGDMKERDIDEDTYELLSESVAVDGYPDCWQVKSTPKNVNDAQYLYRVSYIDKKTDYVIKDELYDKNGDLLKVVNVLKIAHLNGYNVPVFNLIENVQTGHKTQLVIGKLQLDKAVPDKMFTQGFLSTGRM